MSLEISVGPPQLAISEGNLVLLTELDGRIAFPSEKGLYFYDTRLISSWSILVKGQSWELLNSANGLIALGFRRYGFDREASLIMQELLGAGGFFDHHQMPELFAGVQRTPTNFPVHYLGTNVPQAWAAGTIFMLLRMILGFQPDALYDKLYLDPFLPEWLPVLQ